ncbi:MAG: hypothetical protein KJ818_00310, partial [Candidatus Omnitrophica bacterium]|nr:hypothetical protein [Candidatus Omnitrophota bacterium]
DEIIATNILGYAVLPEFESFGLGFKQHFFDRKIYIAGYNNISTTMVTDVDLINLFKENASHLEFGWNITPEASLIIFGRNTYCQLENNDEYEEIVDHLISGQFGISF